MPLHLVKMAVGIESVAHLAAVQKQRLANAPKEGGTPVLRHFTRNAPRRAEEVLDAGSIYWIVKGAIRVRQRILGIAQSRDFEGRRRCELRLDPALVRTVPRPSKPLQGWRYLEASEAPPDLDARDASTRDMPPEMLAELRALGLL